jgi:2-(1,2-epoxy-1,2-dihydrophenyl)acetyl-CoA isomerase
MTYQTIALDMADDVAVLTLSRPDKLNAFTAEMHKEIRDALKAIEKAGARALVITGAGRAFCAGADLAERDLTTAEEPDLGEVLETYYNPLVAKLNAMPIPVLAAVNGVAAGGGANFALSCDLTFAARSASFIQAFVRIGLVPDVGGSFFLPRLIGRQRAMALAMTGEQIAAETAADWGLIYKCADDDALMGEVMGLARRLAAGPTRTIGLIKRLMAASQTNTLDDQLALERDMQRAAGQGEDYREGIQAFLEKRAANFSGR